MCKSFSEHYFNALYKHYATAQNAINKSIT